MSLRKVSVSLFPMIGMCILGLLIAGCSQDSAIDPGSADLTNISDQIGSDAGVAVKSPAGFSLEAKKASLLSCPTGGGVFIIRLVPEESFSGTVGLSLKADKRLDAVLTRTSLDLDNMIAEVSISPSSSVEVITHIIEVKAAYAGEEVVLPLEVEMLDWSGWGSGSSDQELALFIPWLESEYPELGNFSERTWMTYPPYPGILVVEHCTYLDADWELRLRYHVTIPPHDWARIQLRRRGEWDTMLAAERDTYGNIYEIPVVEY